MAKSMLSAQERKLLSETRNILEELLQTEEVLRDRRLMKSIKDSREDVRMGRLYTINNSRSNSAEKTNHSQLDAAVASTKSITV